MAEPIIWYSTYDLHLKRDPQPLPFSMGEAMGEAMVHFVNVCHDYSPFVSVFFGRPTLFRSASPSRTFLGSFASSVLTIHALSVSPAFCAASFQASRRS
jgi:hypothetical protein